MALSSDGAGVDQIGGADRFDIDAEVDAVEQRAGDARLIIGGAAWRAAARQRGVAEVAAAAYLCCYHAIWLWTATI